MKQKQRKIPVSKRALIQRLNRKLAGRQVKRTRGAQARRELGEFYLLDTGRNLVIRHRLDLEAFAREVGALELWEELAQ